MDNNFRLTLKVKQVILTCWSVGEGRGQAAPLTMVSIDLLTLSHNEEQDGPLKKAIFKLLY